VRAHACNGSRAPLRSLGTVWVPPPLGAAGSGAAVGVGAACCVTVWVTIGVGVGVGVDCVTLWVLALSQPVTEMTAATIATAR
jgi:hypothetical protein